MNNFAVYLNNTKYLYIYTKQLITLINFDQKLKQNFAI